MRRMMIVAAFLYSFISAYSQETKKAVEQLNVQTLVSNSPKETKQTIGKDEDLSIQNLNEFQFTLDPKEGKSYKEYQVIKLDGMNNCDVLIGMITGTLERESRYVEISGDKQAALIRQILNDKADYIFISPYDKEYFISSDGTFRYIDGRDLAGSKKVKTYLDKGKPVTASTFFFAMKNKGLINAEVGLRAFISMSLDEKINLLGMNIYASPKETGEDPVSTGIH